MHERPSEALIRNRHGRFGADAPRCGGVLAFLLGRRDAHTGVRMNRLAETNVFNDLGRSRSAALRAEPVALSQAKPAAAIARGDA
jgi:hypothetical protein